ncbi:hypothetical protein LCGC14_0852890, partial [marine sediment metagenome]
KVGGQGKPGHSYRQNWVNRADIEGLSKWQDIFGSNYRVLLVFWYWLASDTMVSKKVGDAWHAYLTAYKGPNKLFFFTSKLMKTAK